MAAPQVPSNLQVYDSYVTDPQWQIKFTKIWCSTLGAAIVVSLPTLIRSLRNGRSLKGFFGVSESLPKGEYAVVAGEDKPPPLRPRRDAAAVLHSITSVRYWTLPYLGLNVLQTVIVLAYLAVVLLCIIKDAPLISNPNRAGFLTLAQIPIVFLFATKNSILSLLLGPGNGYEKLNYIHRMSGRLMFLGACIHGSLWIRNHLEYGLPIIGPQKETSGVATFSVLGIILLTTLRPVRRLFYQAFYFVHVLTFVAFFVTVRYHTLYSEPWIFPALAFFGADALLRFFRYRIKDAKLSAPDQLMTFVHIQDCGDGWLAGQHVQLRVFFSSRVFESHPFTILSAPPSNSCFNHSGMLLAARVNGDWTHELNTYTRDKQGLSDSVSEKQSGDERSGVPIHVMIDGPYGGSSVDLGQYETVLLVAGGSGATFTLSLLDDIVYRCVKAGRPNGERTTRVEFVWCIKSFGHIAWFSQMLADIGNLAAGSSLEIHFSFFVTCLCDPEAVPFIPNCDVKLERPSVYTLLRETTGLSQPPSLESLEAEETKPFAGKSHGGGGVAVCASGPESLVIEARNAVARLGVRNALKLGGVVVHVESFAL
ncbi:iron reductase [Pisolithus croceorrhizus]|nr:iron reductase [Pisolithus croceorrhizus]KAI6114650.1 iron reductase [Pisolithus croceorrhizus]KAI6160555.1 iron reductase [Pisolithus thermaeus]